MRKYFCYAIGFIFGSLMLFGGAYVLHTMPSLFADKIKANLIITNGTEAYTRYTRSSVPLQVKWYLFNVTNPEEVVANGAKPILSQVGPFSFSERRQKKVLAFSPDNRTLTYRLYRSYFFEPSDSKPLDTILTLPNAPAFSAAFSAEAKKYDDDSAADPTVVAHDYLANETIYLTHTVQDWLFNGIKLNWLESMLTDSIPVDDPPPENKFGFLFKKNNTWDEKADGTMNISTGVDGDFANIGQVVRWNNKQRVSYWRGDYCNTIKGTDGQFFHPFVQKDERLDIFAPDLCRTLQIEYIATTSIRSIELYRFGISQNFFKPINDNEETNCYCTKGGEEKKRFCSYKALIDVSSCRRKPIILSTPHFYNGDDRLREAVVGLSPSASAHDTNIDVEPMTGAVLRVRRRLQVNLEMKPNDIIDESNKLNAPIVHPILWMEQSIVIPDELAQKLENKLTKIVRMVRILCYAAVITGPIILIATLILLSKDVQTEDKKIRTAKTTVRDASGDYQKVQVIMKPLKNDNTNGSNDTRFLPVG